ncbi:cupin domain-containing protein [Actinomycetospora flava]|uniref:Cupin domain-containing protein n=1 Tax=Actinomycetospora flava TaxID=3129232 RepID=A0ABU8MEH7_9PSEU
MTLDSALPPGVLAAGTGEITDVGGYQTRYLLDAGATSGRFSLMELLLPPRVMAAPLHRHSREDDIAYVTRGRIGALLGDVEVEAGPGDLIVRPRGQWHTFWNAGDEPAGTLEMTSPGGLEQMFREMEALGHDVDPEVFVELAARYGCDLDLEGTDVLVQRHGLVF